MVVIVGSLEQQIVQALTGLLALTVSTGIAYAVPKAKEWLAHHLNAQQANVANTVLTGLAKVAQTVVANFNQTVVADAKAAGKWTPELAAQVKADAVKAVIGQASNLVALGNQVSGDIPALIGSMIEQAVATNKVVVPQQSNTPQQ
jgi:hypothetical protein